MEENTVELFDYLKVIWKRKIFIIVVTLVCTVAAAAVVVVDLNTKPKVTYCAKAVIKIGKKVKLVPSNQSSSSIIEYIENPGNLVETIPLYYKVEEGTGYHLYVERIGHLAMLRVILKGPDKGVERVLKEAVNMLIDKHRIMVKDSVFTYKNFMKNMEAEAEMLKKNLFFIDEDIKEMKRKEGEYLINIEANATAESGDKTGGDRSAFLNMLYLKTIDRERDLSSSRSDLRRIQQQLSMHQLTLGNLEEYKTELVGEIKITVEKEKAMKSTKQKIMLAGFASLIMSLCIAFFKEYLEESRSKSKRNENGKVDLA